MKEIIMLNEAQLITTLCKAVKNVINESLFGTDGEKIERKIVGKKYSVM